MERRSRKCQQLLHLSSEALISQLLSIYHRRLKRFGQLQVNPLPCQRLTGGGRGGKTALRSAYRCVTTRKLTHLSSHSIVSSPRDARSDLRPPRHIVANYRLASADARLLTNGGGIYIYKQANSGSSDYNEPILSPSNTIGEGPSNQES